MSFDFGINADATPALRATDQTEKALEDVETQAKKTGASMNQAFASAGDGARDVALGVGDIVEAAAAYMSLHFAEEMVDGYTQIQNRLNLVSTSQANLNGLMDATFNVAQDTRTAWEQTVETYQRLSNATRGLGVSQQQTMDLTRTLAEGIKISGSNSQQASAALADFAHAFQVGALTGREFKVEMKDANVLMNTLQKASGKTGAEFAEMGKKGRITAEMLMEWFDKAGPEIEAKFGKIIPTISDNLTLLHNAATKFFGEAGAGAGVMQMLGDATQWVVKHFETIGKVLLGVGEGLLALLVIEKVVTLVKLLGAAIAANPLGALLVAAVALAGVLRQFGDDINTDIPIIGAAGDAFATVGDVLRATWVVIKQIGSAIGDFIVGAWTSLKNAFSDGLDSTGIKISLGDALRFIATFVATAIEMIKHFKDVAVVLFVDIPIELANAFISSYPVIKEILEKIVNGVLHAVNGLKDLANAPKVYMLEKQRGEVSDQQGDASRAAVEAHTRGDTAEYQKQLATVERLHRVLVAMDDERDRLQGKAIGFDLEVDTKALSDMARAARDHRVNTTQDVQKAVESDVQFWESLIQKFASMRVNTKREATVGTDKGPKDASLPDEKAQKAWERLREQYLEVAGASNPIAEAQYKVAHAQEVVNKAVVAGIASYDEGAQVMDNYREKLKDALDPYSAWLEKQAKEFDALGKNKVQRAEDLAVFAAEQELRKKGLTIGDAEAASITKVVRLLAQRREESAMLDTIRAPWDEYNKTIAVGSKLLQDGTISQYDFTEAVKKARDAYIATTPYAKTFAYGLEQGLRAVKETALDVASTVKTQLVDAFNDVETAISDLVMKGTVDWKTMVKGMLSDTTKVLTRMAEAKVVDMIAPTAATAVSATATTTAITAGFTAGSAAAGLTVTGAMTAGGSAAGGMIAAQMISAGIGVASAIATAMAAGGAANAAAGLAGAAAGAAGEAATVGSALAGFATGGGFTVGGGGGTDSSLVAFRATPGERVTINRPGEVDNERRSRRQGTTKVVNQWDPNELYAAIDSPQGERLVLNIMDRNNRKTRKGHTSKT